MKKLLSVLLGDSAWLVLLAVAAAGAWMYAEMRHAQAERDDLTHWAEVACATSGAAFAGDDGEKSGTRCRLTIAGLADFKAKTDQLTAATLAQALADHDARQLTDNQAARHAADAARAAAERMEAADAKAERTNLVDREWFAAVNGVAGLRASR